MAWEHCCLMIISKQSWDFCKFMEIRNLLKYMNFFNLNFWSWLFHCGIFENEATQGDWSQKSKVQFHFIFSGVYNVSSGVSQFTVNVAGEQRRGLQLRGDILIKCYHRGDVGRETIFSCQFHTCAVADYTLSFTRQELDIACNGEWL